MKTEVYKITGCAGSQKLRSSLGVFPNVISARKEARKLNETAADSLGMSFREYSKGNFGEGWHFAGRAGFDGYSFCNETMRQMR